MINLLTGRPGNGKTYVLAAKCKKWLEQGIDVYSNFKLDYQGGNLHYWAKPQELLGLEKGIVAMDEAHVYFNSRDWASLDKDLQRKFQQHRKDGLHIWGTVQHEARIDVIIRELVTSYYQCSKLIGSAEEAKNPWGLISCAQFYPEEVATQQQKTHARPNFTEWYWIRKEICQFYDTLAKIDLPQTEGEITLRATVCAHCNHRKILSS